jgi:hypothetical protein
MPIIGSFGSGSAGGFGQARGGKPPQFFDYMFIAGGGAGGSSQGGGGAGGFRTSYPGGTQLELSGGKTYTVVVGAGGTPGAAPTGAPGGDSQVYVSAPVITFESDGGGGGNGNNGGSGGGNYSSPGGTGNTPPYSPPQGNPGGFQPGPGHTGGGGGGAGGAGGNGGNGGGGSTVNITGSPFTAAGGGGGGYYSTNPPGQGSGGSGGGGSGFNNPQAGTQGLGGGGGGRSAGDTGGGPVPRDGANGGNGKIYFRYPNTEVDPVVTPGSNTITDVGSDRLITFNVSGTLKVGG